ncbi:hypothetical protein RJZ90_004464 [Blastomyces dermatitidis]
MAVAMTGTIMFAVQGTQSGEDNRVVANEAPQAEEKSVEVEEEPMPNLASLLKSFKCQEPNKPRRADRNSNVGQRNEESHGIKRGYIVRTQRTTVPLRTSSRPIARMASRKRSAIKGAVTKFMGKFHRRKALRLTFAILIIIYILAVGGGILLVLGLPGRYYSQRTERINDSFHQLPRNEDRDVKGGQDDDIWAIARGLTNRATKSMRLLTDLS